MCAAVLHIKGAGGRVFEDNSLQIFYNLRDFFGAAHQGSHIAQIHAGFLPDGYRQCLHSRVHAGNGAVGLDGALGEHIRLALQFPLLVDNLQRAEQRIGGILLKGQLITGTVQQPVFFAERIIEPVQLRLFGLDFGIVRAGKL